MTGVPGSRAAHRLRRTRRIMALLFAGVTAACLALLTVLALRIDATSRADQLAADVAERAGGLARGIYFDGGTLHLEPLADDELAVGATVVGVYLLDPTSGDAEAVYHSGTVQPAPGDLARWVDQVVEDREAVQVGSPTPSAGQVAWAAAPVWDDDTIGAVVVVGQTADAQSAAHERLVLGLVVGCALLLAAGAGAGYVLSGRAMRPAVDALGQQEQFLAEAAHELRTPLTTLRLLVEDADPDSTSRALAAVDRVDHLLTALLTRARTDAGTYEVESSPLRLDQLVRSTIEELGRGDDVAVDAAPVVTLGDPVLLGQALRNLLDNADRHAPGTPIEVVVAPGQLTVSDHGPGIHVEQRVALVERGAGTGGGTGAGLAIATWVAEVHGGRLVLDDTPGGGLSVRLVLPAHPDEGAAPTSSSPHAGPATLLP